MTGPSIAALIVPAQPTLGSAKVSGTDPLAPIAGKSIYAWIVDAALAASVRRIGIIADHPSPSARSELARRSDDAFVEFITPMRDVAETLMFAVERLGSELTLSESAHVLLLPAEAPQLQADELRALVDHHVSAGVAATLLVPAVDRETAPEPTVVRGVDGQVLSITDASDDAGVLCIRASLLIPALNRTIAPRWNGGAPLAEIAGVLTEVGHTVDVVDRAEPIKLITSAASRAPIEMELRDRVVAQWVERDVMMPDPRQVSIDATVTIGKGVQILPGTVLEGATVIGDGAIVGPNAHIVDASIGSRSRVPQAVIRGADVPPLTQVQPFSVLIAGSGTEPR